MSDATTHLLLPYILAAQAQKHVTHNEALRLLDGLVHLSVLDRDLAAPPASPADGDRYIVASGATGDWAGWDLNVALWTDGAWLRLPPRTGWRAWVEDGVGTWTKIAINNTDYNHQGAFDAANNHFVAPADGTYLFGATLMYKVNSSTTARMRGRLVLNGTTEIRGSLGEISATHVSLATAIWLQTMVPLAVGDTVELQGYFRVADGYFADDRMSFWGAKVG